jgi:hypothetical protein
MRRNNPCANLKITIKHWRLRDKDGFLVYEDSAANIVLSGEKKAMVRGNEP